MSHTPGSLASRQESFPQMYWQALVTPDCCGALAAQTPLKQRTVDNLPKKYSRLNNHCSIQDISVRIMIIKSLPQ